MIFSGLNPASKSFGNDCRRAASEVITKDSYDAFWTDAAREVLGGLIMHVVNSYPAHERTLQRLSETVNSGRKAVWKIVSASGQPIARHNLDDWLGIAEPVIWVCATKLAVFMGARDGSSLRLPPAPASINAVPRPSNVPAVKAGNDEAVNLPRVCGMFDKPYLARYVRGADKRFRLAGTVKLENTAGAGKGSAASDQITFGGGEISTESTQERCPWCGVKSATTDLVFCGKCDAWVCSSQVTKRGEDDYFQCRKSCGNSGIIGKEEQAFEGSRGEAPRSGEHRAALPGTNRLRLKP